MHCDYNLLFIINIDCKTTTQYNLFLFIYKTLYKTESILLQHMLLYVIAVSLIEYCSLGPGGWGVQGWKIDGDVPPEV